MDHRDGGTTSTAAALRQVRPGEPIAVQLQGVITYAEPGVLFVQHSAGGSRIERGPSASGLVPGDHVAGRGLTSFGGNTKLPTISKATFTKLAPTKPPPPQFVRLADLRTEVCDATRAAIELSGNRPLLTHASSIRKLSPAEAARHYPVRLRGVVTYANKNWQMLFVQDSTGGVFVDTGSIDLAAGDLVDVRGWSDPGNYAPEIIRPTIERLGRAPLPAATPVSIERLLTGKEDSQWTVIHAVVRGISRVDPDQLFVYLAAGRSRFTAVIPAFKVSKPVRQIDLRRALTLTSPAGEEGPRAEHGLAASVTVMYFFSGAA